MSDERESLLSARDECAKLIDEQITPLLESGSLPPMWPWWLPLVDAIAERLEWHGAEGDLPEPS